MLQMYHHSNPVAHRSHKKTSTGCKSCKIRKVKCDEAKPVCKKCKVHFSNIEKCDYEPTPKKLKAARKKELVQIRPAKDSYQTLEVDHIQIVKVHKASSSVASDAAELPQSAPYVSDRTKKTLAWRKITNRHGGELDWRGFHICKCPCHASEEYADMLSDALFGICRICGNFPSWTTSIEQCCPVVSPTVLRDSRVDPFGVLPIKSSLNVNSLMHHWVNTLAMFPTTIHSNYCTNPTWLTSAIANAALFNVTLYVSSLHMAGLKSLRESPETLYYKAQTIQCLNECLKNDKQALSDETIAAVLCLLFVVCVTGDEDEVEAHLRGLRQMIKLRGGIHDFAIDGVFLHMMCTTNHITAVLVETPAVHPSTGPPVATRKCLPQALPSSAPLIMKSRASDVWREFGIQIGFHSMVAGVLHELSYAYSVVDAFTKRLLPMHRKDFEDICLRLESLELEGAIK